MLIKSFKWLCKLTSWHTNTQKHGDSNFIYTKASDRERQKGMQSFKYVWSWTVCDAAYPSIQGQLLTTQFIYLVGWLDGWMNGWISFSQTVSDQSVGGGMMSGQRWAKIKTGGRGGETCYFVHCCRHYWKQCPVLFCCLDLTHVWLH